MNPASKQDVQGIIDNARNRLEQRTVARQDILNLTESIKQLVTLHQQSQQMIKQSEYQRLQLTRRSEAVETRLSSLENEIRSMSAALSRVEEQHKQPVVVSMPAQADRSSEPGMLRQFGYQS